MKSLRFLVNPEKAEEEVSFLRNAMEKFEEKYVLFPDKGFIFAEKRLGNVDIYPIKEKGISGILSKDRKPLQVTEISEEWNSFRIENIDYIVHFHPKDYSFSNNH